MSVPTICVALVLYRMKLEESPTYLSWERSTQGSDLCEHFSLLVFDNTPGQPAALPSDFKGQYLHQPSNPGLAASYNVALARANSSGQAWLMLLDQDTVVTPSYLQEAMSVTQTFAEDATLAAAVPKLMENGIVQSPHRALTTLRPPLLSPDFHGFPAEKLHIYNSGALIRVSSMQAIGGFPLDFWLDYLDHATFHLLQQDGRRILVMRPALEHQLSANEAVLAWNRNYLRRHGNVLRAESLFYRRYGTRKERRWYRLRLLRMLYGALKHVRLPIAWQLLTALVRSA